MPTPSALVYLFGDMFSHKAVTHGLLLPWRKARVDERNLAVTMFAAEFVVLTEERRISLEIPRITECAGVQLYVFDELDLFSCCGLERELLVSASRIPVGARDRMNIREIVKRVLQRDCFDPWTVPFSIAQAELVQEGYFEGVHEHGLTALLGERYKPVFERIAPLENEASALGLRLESFRERKPLEYETIRDEICQGINSRQECGDL